MAQFAKVRSECKNEQVVCLSPSADVKCNISGQVLVKATGGKGKVLAEVIETYQ